MRHHGEGRTQLIHQYFACLAQVVDIGVVTIASVGQLFHQVFIVVIHTETQGGQRYTRLAFIHSHLFEAVEVADSNVEVTVSGQ
ncbi:hypothetical protein D3C78_1435760 [compost metagenome]